MFIYSKRFWPLCVEVSFNTPTSGETLGFTTLSWAALKLKAFLVAICTKTRHTYNHNTISAVFT